MRNRLRRIVNKFGIDITKHRPAKDSFDGIVSHKIQTVIDIGANVGQFAKEIREKIPGALIYSFEPIPAVFKDLQNNMSSDSKWKGFNCALGSSEGKMEMTVNPYSPSSSLLEKEAVLEATFPFTLGGTKTSIDVKTLDSVISKIEHPAPILLKLDVQGYEAEVLKGAQETLKKTKLVLIEASFIKLYKNQPLFDDVYSILKSAGFSYHGSLQTKRNPKTGENLFEDAIFIRD